MTPLEKHRIRAIKVLLEKADKSVPMLIDWELDDFLRTLLGLPARPKGQPPYVGWLVDKQEELVKPTKTSLKGLALIKKWEGLRTNAYLCPANVWTVGYGHTRTARKGLIISHEEAEELLQEDLKRFEQAVVRLVTVQLNQNQFDALVSFTFNVGINALTGSTLLSLLNRKNYLGAAEQFLRWIRAGKNVLPGLVKRRREEYELFLS